MMTLNLIDVEKSDIKYTLTHFSDSHTHINLIDLKYQLQGATELTIKARLSSLNNVFVLLQSTEAIRSVSNNIRLTLIITYLICGRYDRPMYENDSFDLKLITSLLVAEKYDKIVIYEPHSGISTALTGASGLHILDHVVSSTIGRYKKEEVCLVAPDLGAVKRVEDFAKTLSFEIPIIYSHKDRNILTGEIRGIKILNPSELKSIAFIYDDLVDGGKTFIELAKKLRELGVKDIILVVTHGIFSKGFDVLRPYVGKIITTNSYQDFDNNTAAMKNIQVVDVI